MGCDFSATIKEWAAKNADTIDMIFPAHPVLYSTSHSMIQPQKYYFRLQEEARKNWFENIVPREIVYFESILKCNGTGFFVGDKVSHHEI